MDVDLPDVTWKTPEAGAVSHLVVYQDRLVRDWRWLWLRKKMITIVVAAGEVIPDGESFRAYTYDDRGVK